MHKRRARNFFLVKNRTVLDSIKEYLLFLDPSVRPFAVAVIRRVKGSSTCDVKGKFLEFVIKSPCFFLSWRMLTPMQQARSNFGIVFSPEGFLYAMGGEYFGDNFDALSSIECSRA